MNTNLPSAFNVSSEINRALNLNLPVVALESTVITHGLPRPENLALARDMEQAVRDQGATPATVAVINGKIQVGLSESALDQLASTPNPVKISRRDFAATITRQTLKQTTGITGGTTVAGTLYAANQVGIKVFATGGIGGVHHDSNWDVSTDLQALADTQMIVVCAGAKAILDLPATLEYLETMSVPVVGYQTDDFPAFYSRESGLNVTSRFDNPQEIATFAKNHWDLGMRSAVLVVQPVPVNAAIPNSEIDPIISKALSDARREKISGQAITPFLLGRVKELTGGRAMQANLALLLNNAQLAGQIAKIMSAIQRTRFF